MSSQAEVTEQGNEAAPEEADSGSFDMVMLAPPPDRDDPCAAFRTEGEAG